MESLSFVHPRRTLAILSVLIVTGVSAPSVAGLEVGSTRASTCAVWVVRNALESRAAWRDALDSVQRVGCDRVYLQVSGRWDAYFTSTVFPPPAARPRGKGWADDPFGHALSMAQARGVEVHAWVNALLAWSAERSPDSPDHVFRRRGEWFVKDSRGRSMRDLDREGLDRAGLVGEGWFLDPRIEAVRTELRRFVLEVVMRYPIDGIHLDYIRYPTGWVPEGGADAVTRLVELVSVDVRTVRSDAELSVAVMPRPDIARSSFGQDWQSWVASGVVDEVAPMVYRENPAAVLRIVEAWPAEIPRSKIRVGLRIDRLSPSEAGETLEQLEERGIPGVVLFSHNLLRDDASWRGAGSIAHGWGS